MKQLASKLHNRVRIEKCQETRDEYGQIVKTWVFYADVHADGRFKTGAEYQRNNVDFGDASASVRVRLDSVTRGVTNGDRLILLDFGRQIMAVEAVLPDMATRRHIDFACRIGRNDGD